MIYTKIVSSLPGHYWAHLPGCIAELRTDDGRVLGTIRSPELGHHDWVQGGAIFSQLHEAKKTVEKVVGKK